jgi:hypothetical protein
MVNQLEYFYCSEKKTSIFIDQKKKKTGVFYCSKLIGYHNSMKSINKITPANLQIQEVTKWARDRILKHHND